MSCFAESEVLQWFRENQFNENNHDGFLMNLAELFADEDYRFQMALRRGSPSEFFRATSQHEVLVAEREYWLQGEPQNYSALQPQGEPLLDECLALARDWQTISAEQHEQLRTLAAAHELNVGLGKLWEPDFLLLKQDAAGRFQLLGGCVCFPSSWSLADKMGQGLEFIHGPVPGLNEALGRSIDSLLSKLAPGAAWLRHNWGMSRSPELNQHPSRSLPRLDATVTLSEVWLRIEHQALVALPRSGGILFGIRVENHSLAEVKRDRGVAEKLARALRTMPEAMAAYKGLATSRSQIAALLDDSF